MKNGPGEKAKLSRLQRILDAPTNADENTSIKTKIKIKTRHNTFRSTKRVSSPNYFNYKIPNNNTNKRVTKMIKLIGDKRRRKIRAFCRSLWSSQQEKDAVERMSND